MDINYDDITKNIPEELKRRGKWILWKFKRNPKAKKPAKIPYKEIGGKLIAQNDPKRSYRFGYALALARKHQCGIGLFMGGGIAGIDIDDIDDIDNLPDNIKKLINDFNSYTEISVSGKGLHIIVFSDQTFERKRHGKYELYTERRYFTITGNSINGDTVAKVNLRPFYKEYISDESISTGSNSGAGGWTGTDDEFVRFMGNNKLARYGLIWSGDSYTFENEFNGDNSAMDQALINYLVFYLGPDPERVERVARRSEWYADGAHQDKWERRDYLNRTITRAIRDHRGEYFDPDYGKEPIEITEPKSDLVAESLESLIARMPCKPIQDLHRSYMRSAIYSHASFGMASVLAICATLAGTSWRYGDLLPRFMLNIFGPPSIGKNHAFSFARAMLATQYPGINNPMRGDISTVEGLEDGLINAPDHTLLIAIDEAADKESRQDERQRKIQAKLRQLFSHTGPYVTRMKANNENSINSKMIQTPSVIILKASTSESHRQAVKSSSTNKGDMARTFYFVENQLPPYNTNRQPYSKLPRSLKKMMINRIGTLRYENNAGTEEGEGFDDKDIFINLSIGKRLKTFIDKEIEIIRHEYNQVQGRGIDTEIKSRRIEQSLKIAILLAVFDPENQTEVIINGEITGLNILFHHFKWALDFMRYQENQAITFLKDNIGGDTPFEDSYKKWLSILFSASKKKENMVKSDNFLLERTIKCTELMKKGMVPAVVMHQNMKSIDKNMMNLIEETAINAELINCIIPFNYKGENKNLKKNKYRGKVFILNHSAF